MPKIKYERHTAAFLREVAENVKKIADQLEHAAVVMETMKQLGELNFPYETYLTDGEAFLQQWADAVRDTVKNERRKFMSENGVSAKPTTYPAGKSKPPKSTS